MHRTDPTAALQVCRLAPGAYRVTWPPVHEITGDALVVDVVPASPAWAAIADVVVWTTPHDDIRRLADVLIQTGQVGALLSVINHGHGLWAIYDRRGHHVVLPISRRLSGLSSMPWLGLAIDGYRWTLAGSALEAIPNRLGNIVPAGGADLTGSRVPPTGSA